VNVEYDDGRLFADDKKLLIAVGKCFCGLPQQQGRPCMVGHVEALKNLEKAVLGDYLECKTDRESSCVGVVLVSMIGDALGAPFEGHGSKTIRHTCNGELPSRFYPGSQMGIREAGNRYGMYTDDSNSLLGLGEALCESSGVVDANKIALSYASFFSHEPRRGYPDSAKRVLEMCRAGANIRLTGLSSFCFGSFANGAAMRISALSCCCRASLSLDEFVGLVSESCCASHVHPDAIDAAVVQAEAVRVLIENRSIDRCQLLDHLIGVSTTAVMRDKIVHIRKRFQDPNTENFAFLESITDVGFQLYAPDAVATALWFFVRYPDPEVCLEECVFFGGDCDTTGAMLGKE
jgi:ADP-ribosylglycohydrolase